MDRSNAFAWSPRATLLLIGGLVVVLIAIAVAFMLQSFKPTIEVRVNAMVYNLWLADANDERTQGLSGVESLKPDGGLLMKFDSDGKWGIWMKGMLIPLDIVWLDAGHKVVYIKQNVSPDLGASEVFRPSDNSRYVLELQAGSVSKAAIKLGQEVQFKLDSEQE